LKIDNWRSNIDSENWKTGSGPREHPHFRD
jgi:hypothetical protein